MLFGRSRNHLEALAAEFLPFEKQLHIIVADADMNLQVLQFDPESEPLMPLLPISNQDYSRLIYRSQINGRSTSSAQIDLPHRPIPCLNAPPSIFHQNANLIRLTGKRTRAYGY